MKHAHRCKRFGSLLLLALIATVGCRSSAMSQVAPRQEAARQFDLLVYGADFDAGEHEVFLRTNPDFGSEWVSIGQLTPAQAAAGDGWATVVFPGLSTERFLGQDFRENYLDVRIVTAGGADGSQVAAFYAVPHTPRTARAPEQITRMIESDPGLVESVSLASHVQPRPAALRPGKDYVEHVLAPVKHTLPGVAEVEQLQVEWRNRQ